MMAKKKPRPTGQGKDGTQDREARGLLIRVNHEGLMAVRALRDHLNTSIQALGVEAWNDLLAKHGRKPALKSPLSEES